MRLAQANRSPVYGAALMARVFGVPVVPTCSPNGKGCRFHRNCRTPGKVPLLKGWKDGEASTDLGQIRSWAKRFRECNWGGVVPNGAVVFDSDAGGLAGIPPTNLLIRTSRGWHGWCHVPPGVRAKSPRRGIDVKGPGTLVIVPGSVGAWGERYAIAAFGHWGDVPSDLLEPLVNPTTAPLSITDDASATELIERFRSKLPSSFFDDYRTDLPADADWSKPLFHIECACLEAGMSPEQTFVVARESAVNKYRRDGRGDDDLWRDVQKAAAHVAAQARPPELGRPMPNVDRHKPAQAPRRRIEILGLAELIERVEAAGPPTWLIETLIPADSYGVLGAEDKAGKTFAAADLAISIVAGTPWLGHFACPVTGPVLMFLGEGGERATLRRIRAVAAGKGLELEDLLEPAHGLRFGFRVPKLADRLELAEVGSELEAYPARLVIVDPLYLAAAGAKGSDLYAMGEALGAIQAVTQEAGAALQIVTHWNKTGQGQGPNRFTGVGPGAWGRVLGSGAVERRATDPDGASNVLLRWEFSGSEIGEVAFRMRRRVWAEDPKDLASPLHYEVEVSEDSSPPLSLSQERVLAALEDAGELTVREIGEALANKGPLKGRTIQRTLRDLLKAGLVDVADAGKGLPSRWWVIGGATARQG